MADFKDLNFKVHHLTLYQKHYALIIAKVYIDGNYTLSLPDEDVTTNLGVGGGTIDLVYRLSTNGSLPSGAARLVTIFKHVKIIDAGKICNEAEVRADIGDKVYTITCQVKAMDDAAVTGPGSGQISNTSTIIID